MSYPTLYLQTEEAKNLLISLYVAISDGYYENGPFYFNPKEDGKRKIRPCDTSYHPACPEGFTPDDIMDLEIKVNKDYRLFGLWSSDSLELNVKQLSVCWGYSSASVPDELGY